MFFHIGLSFLFLMPCPLTPCPLHMFCGGFASLAVGLPFADVAKTDLVLSFFHVAHVFSSPARSSRVYVCCPRLAFAFFFLLALLKLCLSDGCAVEPLIQRSPGFDPRRRPLLSLRRLPARDRVDSLQVCRSIEPEDSRGSSYKLSKPPCTSD